MKKSKSDFGILGMLGLGLLGLGTVGLMKAIKPKENETLPIQDFNHVSEKAKYIEYELITNEPL